jgi:uncharacterized integral membrane protein
LFFGADAAMLRKTVTAIVIIPLVVILVGFAVANRQVVTISFDPFDASHPAFALTLPLFAIVFVLLIVGVIVGGVAAWLRQSHWRRAARQLDRDVRALREEVAALRQHPGLHDNAPQETAPPLMLPPMA